MVLAWIKGLSVETSSVSKGMSVINSSDKDSDETIV
jgi:hypothetical protein